MILQVANNYVHSYTKSANVFKNNLTTANIRKIPPFISVFLSIGILYYCFSEIYSGISVFKDNDVYVRKMESFSYEKYSSSSTEFFATENEMYTDNEKRS